METEVFGIAIIIIVIFVIIITFVIILGTMYGWWNSTTTTTETDTYIEDIYNDYSYYDILKHDILYESENPLKYTLASIPQYEQMEALKCEVPLISDQCKNYKVTVNDFSIKKEPIVKTYVNLFKKEI